jgi:hypothetical protein
MLKFIKFVIAWKTMLASHPAYASETLSVEQERTPNMSEKNGSA